MKELDTLEESASKLRATAASAGKQTDLEITILNQQVTELQEKNAKAASFVVEAIEIMKKMKKAEE